MKINEVYSSSGGFLKAEDIGTAKPVVTIESIEMSTRDYNDGKGERSQLVVSFVGKEKKLGLNFTNASRLAELTGSDDSDDWIGRSIKLFVEKVKVGTEMKPSIRIFPELPDAPQEFTGVNSPPDNTQEAPDYVKNAQESDSIPF